MNEPLVSVAMVVCNVDRFLAEAIESILGQTFREFEFVIVDFGSTDKSKAIISSYAGRDDRIRFHEIPHCGLAEARNAACFRAQGRYIAIMDADDIAVKERLAWQVSFMEEHPEVAVLGGAVEWIDSCGRPVLTMRPPTENCEIQAALLEKNPFWQPSVALRRDAFVSIGGYRTVFSAAEDFDLWLRIAERYQIANLSRIILRYRIHPDQMTLRKRRVQVLSHMAAQAAALSRRNGQPDPLDSINEITSEVLAALGVSEMTQQVTLGREYQGWVRAVCAAGEYPSALSAAVEFLNSSDRRHAEGRVVAELRLRAARIYWRQKRFLRSVLIAGRAVVGRPKTIGRPLKPLLQRLGLADS